MTGIEELEERLRTPEGLHLGAPDLTTIRRVGRRRRHLRTAGAAAGTAALVLGIGGAVQLVDGPGGAPDDGGDDVAAEPSPTPTELSPLAARVLAEVEGARKVSAWQVVIPDPQVAPAYDEPLRDGAVARSVRLDTAWYTGVTTFPKRAHPAWLYDEASRLEQQVYGDPETGYEVGSTRSGVLVEAGEVSLACTTPRPGNGEFDEDVCHPSVVVDVAGATYLRWGMGSDDFLEPGKPMELFTLADYADATPSTIWIGGLDGTDVARVEYVTTDGRRLDAEVLPGTLVEGETLFWADVEGELARAVAYDADGAVLDDHPVRPCSDPVDCEVR